MGWHKAKVPAGLLRESPRLMAWQKDVHDGHLSVFAGPEPGGFHLSISHRIDTPGGPQPGRYPTWDEIADARYRFAPLHITLAMLLPPQNQYVNVHPTTFHLWEIPTEQVLGVLAPEASDPAQPT